jgi:CubicO group peptidase (beta-lactamase class C family)
MKARSIFSRALLWSSICFLPAAHTLSPTTSASAQNDDESLCGKVDALFAPWSKDTPGAAVLVIREGRIILKKGYGLANLESHKRIEPDTAFLLGSVTKQFTALTIMMLRERGKLSYDDPLSKFFSEFPPYAQQITIRHLLTHTGGFPEYDDLFLDSGKLDKNYPRSSKTKPSSFEPTAKDALAILATVRAPRFAPGEKWEYSNSGYVILAQIVEKVSGQSFASFLQNEIFKPLGMTRSVLYDETRPKIQNVATSYTLKDGGYRDIDYTPQNAIYGEDNIYTTIEDMYQWDRALYTEELIFPENLIDAFTPAKLNSGEAVSYGFGWEVRKFLGLKSVMHGGSWVGFRTFIQRFPEQHFTVVILSNLAQMGVNGLAGQISKIFLRDKMTFPVAIKVDSKVLQEYVGRYEVAPGIVGKISRDGSSLFLKQPDGTQWRLLAETPDRFFLDGREEESVTFNRDQNGKVISLRAAGITARKVE